MTDVEKLACSLEDKMSIGGFMSEKCCIFRTPTILARHNKKAYIPNGFSVGPFHHHLNQTVTHPEKTHSNFKQTEKLKHKYLRDLISRAESEKAKREMLRSCIDVVKEIAGEARGYYGGEIGLTDDEFLEMLVVDGCFLIELFRKEGNAVNRGHDPVCTMACMHQYLSHDLILLENQLPWPVLDRLFAATQHTQLASDDSLIQLVLEFFSNIFSSDKLSSDPKPFANKDIKHILDLLRLSLVMKFEGSEVDQGTVGWQPFPTGTTLRESGIKFRRVTSTSILDIDFRNGILEMPNLLIQETTETIFRNLISFEQCYPECPPRVTCYAILLDNLINSSKDMEVLCENGVIDNWVNPEDATEYFRKLYQDAYVNKLYYQELCEKVNLYRQRWWPSWQGFFRQNYLNITNQLHAAVVELYCAEGAEIKYSTVQNWYAGDENGRGGIYNFVTKRGLCAGARSKISWTQVETGSAITWKYPSVILEGDDSVGEFYSVALTNNHQQADTGTKMIHKGKNTRSRIISKGISAGKSRNCYRGLVQIQSKADNARNSSQCDSMLIGDMAAANTYPYIQVKNPTARVEHEASTSKISEDQLFYFQQRGIDYEMAMAAMISGFCHDVFNELPDEFSAEVKQLMSLKLEGSVG